MFYHILTSTVEVVSRSTVQSVTNLELQNDPIKKTFEVYHGKLARHLKHNQG